MDLRTTRCTFKLATFVLRSILGNEVVSRNCIFPFFFFFVKEDRISCVLYIFIQRSCISGSHCFASLTFLMRPQKSFSYLTFCCGRVSVGINEGFRIGLGSSLNLSLSCSFWHMDARTRTHTHLPQHLLTNWVQMLSSVILQLVCLSAFVLTCACACTWTVFSGTLNFSWSIISHHDL